MSKDGEPAFPHIAFNTVGGINVVQPGLSKRDYFAGQALAGMCSIEQNIGEASTVAMDCYLLADEMLRASNHCSDCGHDLSETGGGTCQTCEVK